MRIDKNTKIYLGQREIVKIKKGNIVIWEGESTPVVEPDYFYIENTYNGTNTLSIVKSSSGTVPSGTYATSIEYSKDKSTWTPINITGETQTISMNVGDKVYFRNDSGAFSTHTSNDDTLCYTFRNSQSCNAGGNVLTLLDYTDVEKNTVPDGCFEKLFENNTGLVDASQLDITPQTMPFRALSGAFWGCSSLTAAPELPATTVGEKCYQNMFRECTSLVNVPVMKATTLGAYACQQMFLNSTSLNSFTVYVNTKESSSTNNWLKGVASTGTFRNLGGATYTTGNVSGIPTGWVEDTYFYIKFANDTSQNTKIQIKYNYNTELGSRTNTIEYSRDKINWTTADLENISENSPYVINCTRGEKVYFRNNNNTFNYYYQGEYKRVYFNTDAMCSIGGSIVTLVNYETFEYPINTTYGLLNRIFYNLSLLTDASNLTINKISGYHYDTFREMFSMCTSLTTAPTSLPIDSQTKDCYTYMFMGCHSLVNAPALPETTLGTYCYNSMFYDCTSLTTAPELPATELRTYCYQNMFQGCTSLVNPPSILNISSFGTNCCEGMFYGCTSLTETPVLKSSKNTSQYAFQNMFNGCTSLNKVVVYLDGSSSYNDTYNWLYNVAQTGTFYNGGTKSYTTDSASGIPTGWTVSIPSYVSVNASPNTFSEKSWMDSARIRYTLIGTDNIGNTIPISDMENIIQTGQNTGSSTVSHNETLTYDTLNYSVTINQTANDTEPDYFWIKNKHTGGQTNNVNINFKGVSTSSSTYNSISHTIEYSKDKTNWTKLDFSSVTGTSTETVSLDYDEKLYLRNDTGKLNYGDYENYYGFTFNTEGSGNGTFEVGGELTTLVDYRGEDSFGQGAFCNLFYNGNGAMVTDASALVLPPTTTSYCYKDMFNNSFKLTSAPALPATKLSYYCYVNMFSSCNALTAAPALPYNVVVSSYSCKSMFEKCSSLTSYNDIFAVKNTSDITDFFAYMFTDCTSLVNAPSISININRYNSNCFEHMFQGCTSLTTAPALPATEEVGNNAYRYMFAQCTSLTTAPALPATTVGNYCYANMFGGCSRLVSAPALPATTLGSNCYTSMFESCTSLVNPPSLPATTLKQSCYSAMFNGCSSLTTAPALPATTLENNCYNLMFTYCTGLTSAPVLPATTLVTNCYSNMFQNCTSLNSVTSYAQNISATNCLFNWLSGVAQSGTFNNFGLADYSSGSSGIPAGWTETSPIQSISASPDTFTLKSYQTKVTCLSTLTITLTDSSIVTKTNSTTITVGENTGDSTRTLTETIPYKGSSYQVTIVQTANDPVPTYSWDVVSTGAYPFQLGTDEYYVSTNKGYNSTYSYATLNYSGFDELVLECISYGESGWDYGLVSQPDVSLAESTSDDGATGSANVFHNFKNESSATPQTLTIPSDKGSHFITIKYKKDGSGHSFDDTFKFKVVEPS